MEYVNFGPFNVSRITLGSWSFSGGSIWGERDKQQSIRIIHAAIDNGITMIDTAEGYGDGESEAVLGEALAGRREKVVLATKFLPKNIERSEDIRRLAEESLRRLRTDYIDLYQQHWPFTDSRVTQDELTEVVSRLQQEGKIRQFGVCNHGPGDLDRMALEPVSNQVAYSLLARAVEYELLPRCTEPGVGVMTYSPLMQGLLSGKYRRPEDFPAERRRTRHFSSSNEAARHGEAGYEGLTFNTIAVCAEIAEMCGVSLAHAALAWVLAQSGVGTVIVGAGSEAQLTANIEAAREGIPEQAVRELSAASEELKRSMGKNGDLWQGSGKSRMS